MADMKNIIDQSHDAHMNKCRRQQAKIDKQPEPVKTTEDLVKEIKARYRNAICVIGKTGAIPAEGVIDVECNHGDCDDIGQFALRSFSEIVYTYYVSHIWKRGHISIYLKR